MKPGILAAIAATALALLPSSEARAYTFISQSGCAAGRGAAWMAPTPWRIQDIGYSRLPFETVETVLKASMETWSAPCCSGFKSVYMGTATQDGLSGSRKNVVSFVESNWPREFGSRNSTIAVTLPQPNWACAISYSDMVFNAVGFTFRTNGSDTDLQSIATHEFGHWAGLDHTNLPGNTMQPFYMGGTVGRTLGPDDTDGICALYPSWCESCVVDEDCPSGQVCKDGTCETPSCKNHDDCAPGMFCSVDTCVPGCRTHLECGDGEFCQDGVCSPLQSRCTICSTCTQDSDCGPGNAYLCLDMDGTGVGSCTKTCTTDAGCDGDSRCWALQNGPGVIHLCATPDVRAEFLCPPDYVCADSDGPSCPGLWRTCGAGADGCGGLSDYCVSNGSSARCSCTCRADADCGEGAYCLADPATGTPACYPGSVTALCGDTRCAPGHVCVDGACQAPCTAGSCGEGEICDPSGACIPACGTCPAGQKCDVPTRTCVSDGCNGVVCEDGSTCIDGECVKPDPCEGIECPEGKACVHGECFGGDPCADAVCAPGTACVEGTCQVPVQPGTGVTEGAGSSKKPGCSGCGAGGGDLALVGFLAIGGMVLRRRRA
ncbi:matrixin family metalloprotease [Vulgatibacter incomptus]|uniref:Peptidase metallopeptidase domain-containing protein n=1 Tax=Vulgatibacter incomptus TaxID=1391653 RepID=A0A0K1PDK5_9BACT|nr:matrixin family metalloprotease [Vulgatibacter incomptus]AKU91600.1 hypothetical protein AKJ08_1987 [Vulgatibacter incomptus]